MKLLSKVVWSEGMYLAPHHFQVQNRYFEDSTRFALSSLWRAAYGLLSCQMDHDAIRNGTIAVLQARGVFPDGLPFDMPQCDPLPAKRSVAEAFSPLADSLVVCLAVPRHLPSGANCSVDPGSQDASMRFQGALETLPDENTGQDEKPVALARKNIGLTFASESHDERLTLPLARILRDTSGHFVYDPKFIPPCLKLSASDSLVRQARGLVETLEEKSSALSLAQRADRAPFRAGFSPNQVANFWILHSMNSSLAPLRHMAASGHAHPEELYCELLRLGGALCTFGLDSHPRSLPVYDHDQPELCFAALEEHIRRHLEIVLPSQAISIPLKPGERYFYEGDVKDDRCFGRSRWIFGIQASVGEADLIRKVPQLVKLCSAKFVPELVRRAVAGLTLSHLAVPPAAVRASVESQYFAINKAGPCWEHILQSKRVGVYVPGEFPKAELELIVLLES